MFFMKLSVYRDVAGSSKRKRKLGTQKKTVDVYGKIVTYELYRIFLISEISQNTLNTLNE